MKSHHRLFTASLLVVFIVSACSIVEKKSNSTQPAVNDEAIINQIVTESDKSDSENYILTNFGYAFSSPPTIQTVEKSKGSNDQVKAIRNLTTSSAIKRFLIENRIDTFVIPPLKGIYIQKQGAALRALLADNISDDDGSRKESIAYISKYFVSIPVLEPKLMLKAFNTLKGYLPDTTIQLYAHKLIAPYQELIRTGKKAETLTFKYNWREQYSDRTPPASPDVMDRWDKSKQRLADLELSIRAAKGREAQELLPQFQALANGGGPR